MSIFDLIIAAGAAFSAISSLVFIFRGDAKSAFVLFAFSMACLYQWGEPAHAETFANHAEVQHDH